MLCAKPQTSNKFKYGWITLTIEHCYDFSIILTQELILSRVERFMKYSVMLDQKGNHVTLSWKTRLRLSRNTTLCHVTTPCSVTHLSFIAGSWWRLGVTIRDREQNHRTLTACIPTTMNKHFNIRGFETKSWRLKRMCQEGTPVLGQFCTEVINQCISLYKKCASNGTQKNRHNDKYYFFEKKYSKTSLTKILIWRPLYKLTLNFYRLLRS